MQACALTDQGKIRKSNQDYVFCSKSGIGPLPNLFIVADGMGGEKAGDYASRFFVEEIKKLIQKAHAGEMIYVLKCAIEAANEKLYRQSVEEEKYYGMGTTAVMAVINGNKLYAANVGDSRLYISGKKIRQITRDHSYVEEMVALGKMERGSQDYMSKKNIITRAVGTQKHIETDFFEQELSSEDIVLLCSDGLTNMLDDSLIHRIIQREKTAEDKAGALIRAANDNGGRDNISAIVIMPQTSEVGLC